MKVKFLRAAAILPWRENWIFIIPTKWYSWQMHTRTHAGEVQIISIRMRQTILNRRFLVSHLLEVLGNNFDLNKILAANSITELRNKWVNSIFRVRRKCERSEKRLLFDYLIARIIKMKKQNGGRTATKICVCDFFAAHKSPSIFVQIHWNVYAPTNIGSFYNKFQFFAIQFTFKDRIKCKIQIPVCRSQSPFQGRLFNWKLHKNY